MKSLKRLLLSLFALAVVSSVAHAQAEPKPLLSASRVTRK